MRLSTSHVSANLLSSFSGRDGVSMCCPQVYNKMLQHAKSGHAAVGTCCSSVAHPSHPDFDGCNVYLGRLSAQLAATLAVPRQQSHSLGANTDTDEQAQAGNSSGFVALTPPADSSDALSWRRRQERDSETFSLIKQHAADMAALCDVAERDCSLM